MNADDEHSIVGMSSGVSAEAGGGTDDSEVNV